MKTKEQKETYDTWIEARYSLHDKVCDDINRVFMKELHKNIYPINEFTDNTTFGLFEVFNLAHDNILFGISDEQI